jgi:imidazolonepropionase-like amidohydrolase
MPSKPLLIGVGLTLSLALFFILLPTPAKVAAPATSQTSASSQNETSKETSTSSADAASFVLGPVELFDGDHWQGQRYIEVRQGRITQISERPLRNELLQIDGGGRSLLPGLIDAHVHTYNDALEQAAQYGVTTVFDMFMSAPLMKKFQAGRETTTAQQRADLYSAGTLVTAPKGHGTEYGMAIPTIDNPAQAERFVADRIAEGSDYIKIVYQSAKAPRKFFPSIDLATLTSVIAASHQQGKLAVVHISDQQSALDAVRAGANGLVHSFIESRVQPALLAAMKANHVFIIPTMAVHEAMTKRQHSAQFVLERSDITLSAPQRQNLKQGFTQFNIPPALFENLLYNTRVMHEQGIRILAGTDAPNPGTAHGISLPLEMLLLQQAGLSVDEVLRSATSVPADSFGIAQLGRIQVGAKADLLLVGDVRSDLSVLLKPESIWKNGVQINPIISAAAVKLQPGLLADFANSSKTLQGLGISATSDQMMQGNSVATMRWIAEGYQSAGAIRADGEINPGFGYPWSGLAYLPGLSMEQGADLSPFAQITFAVRGTPGQYQFQFFSAGSMLPVSVPFTVTADWQVIKMPLSQFAGAELSAISMMLWSAAADAKQPGYFLELDEISVQ